MYTSLISVQELKELLGTCVIVDCSFDLDDTESGRRHYEKAHIPGAVYADLDEDLSSDPVTDKGRHPLPSPEAMKTIFEGLGISNGSQVVVYDSTQGMYSCRLWWMLRYMGHEAVCVLDGGFTEWERSGMALAHGVEENPKGSFEGRAHAEWLIRKHEVASLPTVVDSRDPVRYRGEIEHRDPRAGHIPGALNYPWKWNLGENGRFLPPEVIKKQLADVLGEVPPSQVVFYCGSGVTSCLNVLAVKLAGLGTARVYVGSWSEWSRDSALPIAIGDE